MKVIKLAIVAASLTLLGAASSPPPIGAWSSVKLTLGDDPHASGLEVEIREHDGELVGFLSEYVGPTADPPVGKLQSLRFDEKTGFITFTAKFSVGVVPAEAGNSWLPSRNVYEFKGAIVKSGLTGTLRRNFIQEDGTELSYEENVMLRPKTAGDHAPSESYQDWLNRWNEALKARGPKW